MDLVYKVHKHSRPPSIPRLIFQPPTYAFMGILSKIILWHHRVKILGKERFTSVLRERPKTTPFITVSNHYSCLDDFFLMGSLLSLMDYAKVDECRWSFTAVDICHTNWFNSHFISWYRGVPVYRTVRNPVTNAIIHRGGGVYQPSMDFCINMLNAGQWVHIFPQARIIHPHERSSETKLRLRWGIGRLIAETKQNPIVLPIWHCGLDELNPSEHPNTLVTLSRCFGRPKYLTIAVGEPIPIESIRNQVATDLDRYKNSNSHRSAVHAQITQLVQERLYCLKLQTEQEHKRRINSDINTS